MKLIDIIILSILAVLIGSAIAYIIKAKKRGQKCIGCPYSGQCNSSQKSNGCNSSCRSNDKKHNKDCYKIKVDI